MAWAFLAVSLVGALVVVNAYRPVRREPLAVASFVLGWIPSELPVHVAVLGIAVTAVFASAGALGGWTGWTGLAIAAASWAGLAGLSVAGHRARDVVESALDAAFEGAAVRPDPEHTHPTPRWATWWRLVLAVPYRPHDVRRVRDVDYWGDRNKRHRLDILSRRSPAPERAPVLVYVHGGAWVIGDKREQGMPMLYEFVRRGWVCVSVNYRLSPKSGWPDHLVDCKRALAWVRSHIADHGGDPEFIAVSGASAGGHLCSLLALTPGEPSWQPGFEGEDTSVDACVPFYGVYDMTGDPDGMGISGPGFLRFLEKQVMRVSAADDRALFERASPDRWISGSAPPMLVFHGANDSLVPREVARRFVDRLHGGSRAPVAYVELPCAQHAFDVLDSVRCRHTTMGAVRFLEAMRRRTGGARPEVDPARARDRPFWGPGF